MSNRCQWVLPFAGLALFATFVAAGCGDTSGDTIIQPSTEAPGIAVSGKGEVQAPPDTGFFDVGVSVTATTVADARDRAAKAADAVIGSVKKNGVDNKDIKTTQFRIDPMYDYGKNGGTPRITGYTVTNTVEVKVRKLDNFSKIVDDAVAAGGDQVRIQGIRFDIEDSAKLLEQAREAAMKDAKEKADQLARLGGVKLGTPLAISEQQSSSPPPILSRDAKGIAASEVAPTPIEAGTGSVVVNVEVRWGIEK